MRFSDKDRLFAESNEISKEKRNRHLFNTIKNLCKEQNEFDKLQLEELKESFGTMIEAFKVLGATKIKQIGFKDKDLKAAMSEVYASRMEKSSGVRKAVYLRFKESTWYSRKDISRNLGAIYASFDIPVDSRGISSKIKLYFDAKERQNKKDKGWYLEKKLFN